MKICEQRILYLFSLFMIRVQKCFIFLFVDAGKKYDQSQGVAEENEQLSYRLVSLF